MRVIATPDGMAPRPVSHQPSLLPPAPLDGWAPKTVIWEGWGPVELLLRLSAILIHPCPPPPPPHKQVGANIFRCLHCGNELVALGAPFCNRPSPEFGGGAPTPPPPK